MENNILINKGARGAEALALKSLANKGARGASALAMENNNSLKDFSDLIIENFDGIRKDNARVIFGILLIIIVVDFGMEMFN